MTRTPLRHQIRTALTSKPHYTHINNRDKDYIKKYKRVVFINPIVPEDKVIDKIQP